MLLDEEKSWPSGPPADAASQNGTDQTLRNDEQASQLESSPERVEDGYLVNFDDNGDPWDPRTLPVTRKWIITATVAMSSFCVTVNSTLYTFTYTQLEAEFGVSREVCTLGLTTFVIGLALGPMLLAPLSEFYGRRPVYLGAFAMIFFFLIPCAVAQNIQTILVTRFFDGFFASSFLSVAGGTIGDMFVKSELSLPMMVYSASPFLGPSLGPVIGGFVSRAVHLRRSSFHTFLTPV